MRDDKSVSNEIYTMIIWAVKWIITPLNDAD